MKTCMYSLVSLPHRYDGSISWRGGYILVSSLVLLVSDGSIDGYLLVFVGGDVGIVCSDKERGDSHRGFLFAGVSNKVCQ